MCRGVCVGGGYCVGCVLAGASVGLSDHYDCGKHSETTSLVRSVDKLDRPFSGILSYESSLIVKTRVAPSV